MARILTLLLFLTGSAFAQWQPLVIPALGLKARIDGTNHGHIVTEGDTPEHVTGNLTVLGRQGTEGQMSVGAVLSFSDFPGANFWLPTRLDRQGFCSPGPAPYPDAQAAALLVGASKDGGVGLFVGSAIPFGWEAPKQQGGLYNTLYVAQGINGAWSIVGDPVIIDPLPLNTQGTAKLVLTNQSGDYYVSGSIKFGPETATINVKLTSPPDPTGLAAFGAVSHPNMLCLPNRGRRVVNLFEFVTK